MEQFTTWLAGFRDWMVEQSVAGYDLASHYFVVLTTTQQYAIAAVSLVLAAIVATRLRDGGVILRLICFLACLALFLALGIGITYLVLDLIDPDSVVRHPVPRMT